MEIRKEYCKALKRFVVRNPNYGHQLNHILKLVEEARKDFPDLKDEDIEIIQYGGRYYKHTWGVEWSHDSKPPSDYEEIHNTEYTL